MSEANLTDQFISQSFQRLLQVSESLVIDGTGSIPSLLKFPGVEFTGSFNHSGTFPFELELMLDSNRTSYYKELEYDSAGQLTTSSFYDTTAKAILRFDKKLNYDSGFLTSSILTRAVDGKQLTKTFFYDANNNLVNTSASEA